MPGRRSNATSPHLHESRRLGAHQRALREQRGLTRDALAAQAGISPATLARIEQERTVDPGLFVVAGIVTALGTTLDTVLAAGPPPSLSPSAPPAAGTAGHFVSVHRGAPSRSCSPAA